MITHRPVGPPPIRSPQVASAKHLTDHAAAVVDRMNSAKCWTEFDFELELRTLEAIVKEMRKRLTP